jgi:hypothetical protein
MYLFAAAPQEALGWINIHAAKMLQRLLYRYSIGTLRRCLTTANVASAAESHSFV